ncbi:hypothetical protein [Riemerella columbina]|uniref:hypothetical protein n=1 Tax=Riemerella columbina TaxID=103810 RepID=UPI0026704115|nr:hypothetical protein [Riemerella columbina]WKS95940.1 hypothetical protein NYR17_04185 [Riemerella columbina]
MGSNMVNNEKIAPDFGMELIKKLFSSELPKFKLIDSKNMGYYYYAQMYEYKNVTVLLGCERGYLESMFKINGEEMDLNLSENQKILQPNEANFRLIFNLIKKRIIENEMC